MKTDLIYGVEDRPPFKDALFAALQHLLAIFVAIITPPLIIASALKLDVEKTSFLVSMSLFASGVSTFIQCRRIGLSGVFSLAGWSRQIHAEFLVFRATQDTAMLRFASNTGLSPSVVCLSRLFFSRNFLQQRGPTTPYMP